MNRPHTPALPATDRQQIGGAQDSANGAAHSEAGLGKAGARTRARRSLPPSLPPPAALTHWRPTEPRPTPTGARQPPQHGYTPGGRAGDKGWQADTRRGRGAGSSGAAPPPPPPPRRTPRGLRAAGAPTLRPPRAEGTPPLPQKGPRRGRGNAAGPARRAPQRPPPPAPVSPHQRAGATHGPRPGGARDDGPEQYGGRAPHDQSIASDTRNVAHLGRAEGGFRSDGAPGGAVHVPPLPRPPRQAGRTRCTGRPRDPDRTRTPGGECADDKRGAG